MALDQQESRFIYSKYLLKGDYYASIDRMHFQAWAEKRISIYQCYLMFLENNKITELNPKCIDYIQFEGWLNFLGYFRSY